MSKLDRSEAERTQYVAWKRMELANGIIKRRQHKNFYFHFVYDHRYSSVNQILYILFFMELNFIRFNCAYKK